VVCNLICNSQYISTLIYTYHKDDNFTQDVQAIQEQEEYIVNVSIAISCSFHLDKWSIVA